MPKYLNFTLRQTIKICSVSMCVLKTSLCISVYTSVILTPHLHRQIICLWKGLEGYESGESTTGSVIYLPTETSWNHKMREIIFKLKLLVKMYFVSLMVLNVATIFLKVTMATRKKIQTQFLSMEISHILSEPTKNRIDTDQISTWLL